MRFTTHVMTAAHHGSLSRVINDALARRHGNAPAVFVIAYDASSTADLMGLKNHLELAHVRGSGDDGALLSTRRVGFVLVGGQLATDAQACAATALDDVNEKNQWGANFRGRLQASLKLCPP